MNHWLSVVILSAILFGGCKKSPERIAKEKPQPCRIVSVYSERRLGDRDGTTVVETPSGVRIPLAGKLGKEGETLWVNGKTIMFYTGLFGE